MINNSIRHNNVNFEKYKKARSYCVQNKTSPQSRLAKQCHYNLQSNKDVNLNQRTNKPTRAPMHLDTECVATWTDQAGTGKLLWCRNLDDTHHKCNRTTFPCVLYYTHTQQSFLHALAIYGGGRGEVYGLRTCTCMRSVKKI